jgi:hypothetical protein
MAASAMRASIQAESSPQTAFPSVWAESQEPTTMDPTSDMIVTWFAVTAARASFPARGRRARLSSGFRRFRDSLPGTPHAGGNGAPERVS